MVSYGSEEPGLMLYVGIATDASAAASLLEDMPLFPLDVFGSLGLANRSPILIGGPGAASASR